MEKNSFKVRFMAKSENESFARMIVSAFMINMNPTYEEIEDVKMAVSEAVTNSIVHAYKSSDEEVELKCNIEDNCLNIEVIDEGVGIADIENAMEPFFTTKADEERSGMGFSFMEAFMDELEVYSELNKGTRVFMKKYIKGEVNE
ncbi:MAG: anti-sigma F factor [Agathobacter sp.]|nr:anti-sigma F factor [Agathobacter sp.]